MNESILLTIKKLLGDVEEDEYFNPDILIHINSAFSVLNQLGVGPQEGYFISGIDNKWDEFLQDATHLEIIKTYMYFVVKRAFDPPTTATMYSNLNNTITEYEWRINVLVETQQI